MKFQPDKANTQTITAYGPGWVAVDGQRFEHALLITSQGLLQPWCQAPFESLTAQDFAPLAQLGCELVIFGSGQRLRFPKPPWLAPLMAQRIGLESMDTAAACRTYNILAGEGRKVAAVLLIEAPT
jgi:uncharacterized protein